MNFPRFSFSKDAEPELSEFLKAAAAHKSNLDDSEDNHLWEYVLPINNEIKSKIKSYEVTAQIEAIHITDSSEESNAKPTSPQMSLEEEYSAHLIRLSLNQSNVSTENLKETIYEILQTECILSEHVIIQFANDCKPEKLQEIFTLLGNELTSETLLKVWNSIVHVGCLKYVIFTNYFLQYVLLEKMFKQQHDPFLKMLIIKVFNELPEELLVVLHKKVFEVTMKTDLAVFIKHLSVLSDVQKNKLLSTFSNQCSKLEVQQLGVVLCLLTSGTDVYNLRALIELMDKATNEFATDKTFGKLVLEVIRYLGNNVIQLEQQLRYIISNHKSIYKTQISSIFDNLLQNPNAYSQYLKM